MPPKTRYIQAFIKQDLARKKMVFIGGPRQVGKTTLALGLLGAPSESHPGYFNWDSKRRRDQILREDLPSQEALIVLDEIHKYARWRNLVKGLYDTHKSSVRFVVTGSARLDYYRKGGDSLQGRYHYYRLHPFSVGELGEAKDTVERLMAFGGFPEPYVSAETRFLRRWQRDRAEKLLYEDLRDLERVREISLLELLLDALPERVGSPLSVQALAEDLSVAFMTVERWITIFERLYACYRIAPYGAPRIRAVKKERKLYLWDWSMVPEPGPRFENMVASQLLKFCHFLEDTQGYRMDLRFIRDVDKREIDFVVLQNKKPLFAVECKTGEKQLSSHIEYFRKRTSIPEFYQVHLGTKDIGHAKTTGRLLPFATFCRELKLP